MQYNQSQQVWDFTNLKSAVLTGMPWERKYLHPFRAALLSSSALQVRLFHYPPIPARTGYILR
jgi:hypothetical protein